jgi:hypothetical protein
MIQGVISFICFVILSGCVEQMYSVQNAPIAGPEGRTVTLDEVVRAIVQAGRTTTIPWEMEKVRPGFMIGTLKHKQHRAIVNINYSTQDFSITYRDSRLLRYRAPDGIGRHYNYWVEELETRIKSNLLLEHPTMR